MATEISFYSTTLDKEDQSDLNDVVIFSRITYKTKYAVVGGGEFDGVKITKVAGGVVRCGSDYHCEALYLKYSQSGGSFDDTYLNVGYQSNGIDYQKKAGGIVQSGVSYSITVPEGRYWFNRAAFGTSVYGATKADVWHNHYSWDTDNLEVICGWLN